MGSSASAYLHFGVALKAEDSLFYTHDEDYNSVFYDGTPVSEEQEEDLESLDGGDLGEYLAWRSGKSVSYKDRSRLEDAAPVTVEFSGDLQYGVYQYVLALKGDYSRSSYWGAEHIDLPAAPPQEEIDAAVAFCKENGLPSFENAGWVLAANYG